MSRSCHILCPGTQFALDDFFLHEAEPAASTGPEHYTPQGDPDRLTPYYVIPNLTETSLVNLAFASGLMGHALGLDPPCPTAAPATRSSTYSFEFRPHSAMAQVLVHNKGQVEIDAAFIGMRGGRRHLFVLEAKSGHRARTIAKHKLVYPVLALAQQPILADMPIIPLYLKIVVRAGAVYYSITECTLPDPRQGLIALDQLVPVSQRQRQITLLVATTSS